MALDPVKNFAISRVATAPSPAASGTTLVVEAGDGALFPDPSSSGEYNVVIYPNGEQPTSTNAEIVRVTARTTDTMTIDREEESTSARTVAEGDIVMLAITAKMVSDLSTAVTGVVTETDTQTLTNKTLTNPTINFTDKAVSQNVRCSVYLDTTQENIAGGDIKVNLNAEKFDTGSDFDTTNKRFVAPVSGYYQVNASITFTGIIANKKLLSIIKVNGAAARYGSVLNGSDTGTTFVIVSGLFYVASGQYIELYANENSGTGTVDIYGASDIYATQMDIFLVSL